MPEIPYEIVPANEMFGETEPRLLVEEKYMTDERHEELINLMRETGVNTIRMVPTPGSLDEGEEITADGYVFSPGLMDMVNGNMSTPGRPKMPPMKRKRRKK